MTTKRFLRIRRFHAERASARRERKAVNGSDRGERHRRPEPLVDEAALDGVEERGGRPRVGVERRAEERERGGRRRGDGGRGGQNELHMSIWRAAVKDAL